MLMNRIIGLESEQLLRTKSRIVSLNSEMDSISLFKHYYTIYRLNIK